MRMLRKIHFILKDFLVSKEWLYLNKECLICCENDRTGYSEEYGWVHAFAHGADLLVEIICHPDFPITRVNEVLQVLEKILKE